MNEIKPAAWLKHGPYSEGESLTCVFEDPNDPECYSPLYYTSTALRSVARDEKLMYEVGRRAVEDLLIDFRDSRISVPNRNNGCVIKEVDGKPSDIIRLSIEDAVRIAMVAMADHFDAETP